MAILSNINGKFAVDSSGGIQFSGQTGTSGYVLKSNGNAAPTWVDGSTVIGGPYLPLSGGTLTGATATASGISFTVGGALTGTTAGFSGNVTANGYLMSNGSLTTSSFWGTLITAGTGSYADFALIDSGTARIMHVPTGTGNVVFVGSITAASASIATMSVNTNFLGDIFQFGSLKLNNTYIDLGQNALTKKTVSTAYFTNGTSNLACNIQFVNASAQGYYKITLSGSYSYQDISGKLTKVIPFGYNPNGSIWRNGNNQSEITIATGGVSNNFTIGDLAWDSTASKFIIPIYKLSSYGNSVRVTVEHFGGNGNLLNSMTLSSIYTQAAPSPFNTRQYQNIRDRLGIGTTAPTEKLQIVQGGQAMIGDYFMLGSGNANYMGTLGFNRNTTNGVIYNSSYGAFQIHNNNGTLCLQGYAAGGGNEFEHLFFNNGDVFFDGSVGIATTSTKGTLDVFRANGGSGTCAIAITNSEAGALSRNWGISTDIRTAGDFGILESLTRLGTPTPANANLRLYMTSGGDLALGMQDYNANPSSTNYGLRLETGATGKSYWQSAVNAATSHYHYEFINTTGSVGTIRTLNSATSYVTNSDYRLKEDLQDFKGLKMVSRIPVYNFKWKIDDTRSYGVMAHELDVVLPDAVSGEKDDVNEDKSINPQGVDYSKIVPLLVKSIQELEARLKILENK